MPTKVFRRTSLLITVALAVALSAPAIGQESAAAGSAVLTLEECIARALKQNFDLQIQAYDSANAKETLTISEAGFDPTFTASTSKAVSQADVASTTLVGTHSEFNDTRIGVSQKVTTGATVSLSHSLDRSETNNSYSTLNPAYTADLTLTVKQPLLKNAGPTVNKAAINRATLGVTRASLAYQGSLLQVVRDTENAYYNLVFAREQLMVRKNSLALAERLFEENKTRRMTGVATDLNVLQAEVGVANARRNVIDSVKAVRDRQDDLLNLIGQFEFNRVLGEVTLPITAVAVPDFEKSFVLARENQPDYLSTVASIKQLELDAAIAKNAGLPSLDLGGSLGYNAHDGSSSRALDRLPNGDGYAWQLDLSLSVPWGMRSDKARYRTAKNNLQREQARLQQLEQSLVVQVRAAVRAVETNLEGVQISTLATALSEKQYELEKARFDAGLSTSRLVLEAQDSLERARISELQSRVTLRTTLAELHRLEGSSLGRYGIPVGGQATASN
jgi:outer membrane protein TolC